MIELASGLYGFSVVFAGLAVLAALIAAVARKWRWFRRFALSAVLAVLVIATLWLLLRLGVFTSAHAASADSKATLLARGISEGMNLAAMLGLALIAIVPTWMAISRRVSKAD